MKATRIYTLLALLLICWSEAFGQEWEYSLGMYVDSVYFRDTQEMPNGEILVSATSMYPEKTRYPSIFRFSPSGELLGRKDYFKPAFWGDVSYVITDDEGTNYLIAAYSPDHDTASFNYYQNYDNPPDHAIIALYKLDEDYDIIESHETQFPIDMLDASCSECTLNYDSGSLLLFQAKRDGDAIVGVYVKQPTWDYFNPRGNDSIFFFRMDFDGNFLQRVGYETESIGGAFGALWIYDQLIKVGDGYVFCYNSCSSISYTSEPKNLERLGCPGLAYFLDSDFNIQKMRLFHVNGTNDYFQQMSVEASDHNTFYASYNYQKPNSHTGCALYEYGLDDNGTNALPIVRFTTRTSSGWDDSALVKGINIVEDNSLYYAYALGSFRHNLFIEHLTPDYDSIRTLIYEDPTWTSSPTLYSLRLTSDGGALAVLQAQTDYSTLGEFTQVIKFPAEAFMSIEEAHKYGLKTAIAYPNPGGNTLNIRTGLQNAWVEVYDVNGRPVHSQAITEDVTAIDATDWAAGVYVWKVYVGGPSTLRPSSATAGSGTLAESGKWIKE
jgi:hypothetical protein